MSDRKPAPEIGGPTEVFAFERASATPDARVRAGSTARASARPRSSDGASHAAMKAPPLRDVQRWFAEVVTHPTSALDGVRSSALAREVGVRDASDLERAVRAGPGLTPLERLDVYHYAYRARLVECLIDDYPALAFALGEKTFEELARAYIARFPSRSPNLNAFGRHMPAMLRERDEPWRDFAADLARLEWAMVEVIHAPPPPALDPQKLGALRPHEWSLARFTPSAWLRRLRFDHPVNPFLQAFREGKSPSIPERAPSATAIYRQGFTLWRMDLTPAMAALLDDLADGATLGDALARIATHVTDADALAEAERNTMEWFRAWVAGGFFSNVEVVGAEA